MIRTYHDVTVLLGGKPLVTADVTMRDTPLEPPTVEPDVGRSFSFTTTLGPVDADAMDEFFGTIRLPPTQPAGYVSIPWGILGSIRLNGVVDGAMSGVSAGSARVEFAMAENEVRRAVSMAVQGAICDMGGLGSVVRSNALKVPALSVMVIAVYKKRGERKKRRAMRRLLRAAGILGGDR